VGFLTILNYSAMFVGYMVLLLIIVFVIWFVYEEIKEKKQKKKWETERADKLKAEKIVKETQAATSSTNPQPAAQTNAAPANPQPAAQTNAAPTAQEQKSTESKESETKLVDDTGKIKMSN